MARTGSYQDKEKREKAERAAARLAKIKKYKSVPKPEAERNVQLIDDLPVADIKPGRATPNLTIDREQAEYLILLGCLQDAKFLKKVVSKYREDYIQEEPVWHGICALQQYYEQSGNLASPALLKTWSDIKDMKITIDVEKLDKLLEWQNTGRVDMKYLYINADNHLKEWAVKQSIVDASAAITATGVQAVIVPDIKAAQAASFIETVNIGMPWVAYANETFREPINFITPWLEQDTITLCSARAGLGKTLFGLSIAKAITQCEDFGNWQGPSMPSKVLYLDAELPAGKLQRMAMSLGIDIENNHGLIIVNKQYEAKRGSMHSYLITDPNFRATLQDYCIREGVKMLILDNLLSLTAGIDENVKKDWDPINLWLIELRGLGISVLLLHHTGKVKQGQIGTQRGSSAREGNIDNELTLIEPMGRNPVDAHFRTHFLKTRIERDIDRTLLTQELKLVRDNDSTSRWEVNVSSEATQDIELLILSCDNSKPDIERMGHNLTDVKRVYNNLINHGLIEKLSATSRKWKRTAAGDAYYQGLLDDTQPVINR